MANDRSIDFSAELGDLNCELGAFELGSMNAPDSAAGLFRNARLDGLSHAGGTQFNPGLDGGAA
jgi:hypothetical protein